MKRTYPFGVKVTVKNGKVRKEIEFDSNIKTVSKLRENASSKSKQMDPVKSHFRHALSKTDDTNNNYPVNCDNMVANSHKGNHDHHPLTKIKQVMQENETILYQTISYQLSETVSKFDNCIKKSGAFINELRNEDEKSRLAIQHQSNLTEITEFSQNYQNIVNDAFKIYNQKINSYFNSIYPNTSQSATDLQTSMKSSNHSMTQTNDAIPLCTNKKRTNKHNHPLINIDKTDNSNSDTSTTAEGQNYDINTRQSPVQSAAHHSTKRSRDSIIEDKCGAVYFPQPSKRRKLSEINDFTKLELDNSIQFSHLRP